MDTAQESPLFLVGTAQESPLFLLSLAEELPLFYCRITLILMPQFIESPLFLQELPLF